MVISLPFLHDKCIPKTGDEAKRVRARYCSVERVREMDEGGVEWSMATTSDAGGERVDLGPLVSKIDRHLQATFQAS